MKKTIRDFELENKKVLIRVDFNVPMKDGVITDDTRIKESLPTIEYALEQHAKVILLSHLGRVKEEKDLEKNTLRPVAKYLSNLLNRNVIFVHKTRGEELEEAINSLQNGEVLLIENTRYEDLEGKCESKNDLELGKYWASLGDLYINDAFGTAHREHASNVGIASNLPSGIGFLIEKELKYLTPVVENPDRPFVVLLGGSKVSDKIGVINHLVELADYLLIGGGMAFTFLKSQGLEVGNSIVDEENLEYCKNLLKEYPDKIILPIDVVTGFSKEKANRTCFITDIKEDEIGFDIGPQTTKLFQQYLDLAKTIVWNGPVGVFEEKDYQHGTEELCRIISEKDALKIIGGGDSASAVKQFQYDKQMTHISTGGGASLEFLEGKTLPGIDCIEDQ